MAIDLGDAKITIDAEDKASAKLDNIGKKLKGMSKTFQNVGIKMMGAGVLLGGGLLALAKSAATFEGAMREVNTMVGLTEEGFQELSEDVRAVSSEVGKSSTELAGALYQIASAGVAAAHSIDVLRVAAKAAVAGVTSVEVAADGLTTILNAFKISATKAAEVADIMFTVVKRGKTNFEQLSAAMFNVAPIAAAAGVKFEEIAAAIATVTKQGVPTKIATTQLRAAIQQMIKPTDEMARAMEELGYESGDAMLAELGLAGSFAVLTDHVDGALGPLGKMFGSVEALSAVLSLTGENAETFAEDLKATSEDAAGAVETAYDEMNKGVGRQFEILMNDIKEMGIEIGNAILPILKDIIENMKPIIQNFTDWVAANEALFPTLLKLAGILLGVGGIVFAIGQVVKVIAAVNAALVILHSLSGPAGWAKLAAGALIAASAIGIINEMMPDMAALTGGGGLSEGEQNFKQSIQDLVDAGKSIKEIEEIIGREIPEWALPSMKFGGIVPGALGEPVPVMAHGGEEYLGIGNKSSSTLHIHIGNYIGDDASLRKLVRTIKPFLGEEGRRQSFAQVSRGYYHGTSSI